MNDFEKYLADNKESLRKEGECSSDLWDKIDNGLQRKKQQKFRFTIGIAASFIVLLASALLFLTKSQEPERETLPLYTHSLDYGDAEQEFISAVQYQTKLVNTTTISTEYSSMFSPFVEELALLDNTYEGYVEIIRQNGCSDMMMELVVTYYQAKLDILNTLHQELIKIKAYETEPNKDQTSLNI